MKALPGTDSIRSCIYHFGAASALAVLGHYGLNTNSQVERDGDGVVVKLVREDGAVLGTWRGSVVELLDLLDYIQIKSIVDVQEV